MSSNNAKPQTKPFSLAAKLATLFAFTTFAILLVASGSLYWSLLDHLEREHHSLLIAKITQLRSFFHNWPQNQTSLPELISTEHHHNELNHASAVHARFPHQVFVRILDKHGNILETSSPLPEFAEELEFPDADTFNPDSIQISRFQSSSNRHFLLSSAWSHYPDFNQTRRLIQAALELHPDATLLDEYQGTLMAVLIFGVLSSAIGGYFISRRGLAPLRDITATIQRINVHQLNERVESRHWPQELSMLAHAFDEMLIRLDRSFAQLSQFSADLAHELRTPVNNIMGEAEVALSRPRTTDEYCEILESNLEECSRIARMIDELLFLARAENPQTTIQCQLVAMASEFHTIVEYFEHIAAEKHVQLLAQDNQVNVFADSSMLRRVFNNLLSNALRYTPADGQINLSAEYTVQGASKITISDTGPGIPEDHLPYIFDRLYRVDKSRHHDTQGSGLGLAIVKSIIELHKGQIQVFNLQPQGLCVELIFPSNP